MKIEIKKELVGSILDLGGGGEGVIGQIYGGQVIAIDNCQDELDEAPEGFRKVLMDAADLAFADGSFDNVTSFFTLMYMQHKDQRKVIFEAARVLKDGGELHIWDAEIESAYPEPFLADLEINAAGKLIRTTYGIVKDEARQDIFSVADMCEQAGLVPVKREVNPGSFYIRYRRYASEQK